MNLYTYTVRRDYGFAPNPFNRVCTLATCKPIIRAGAKIGDWVIGTGSRQFGITNHLIYAMEVNEKLTFNEYWNDPRFQFKKPKMNGSTKVMFGDNIYYKSVETNLWEQADSHHSHADGSVNFKNLDRDTGADAVLVSFNYYYFGSKAILIPEIYQEEFCYNHVGQRKIKDEKKIECFLKWLRTNYEPGYKALPMLFNSFERFPG
jgi:hypothetical protein